MVLHCKNKMVETAIIIASNKHLDSCYLSLKAGTALLEGCIAIDYSASTTIMRQQLSPLFG